LAVTPQLPSNAIVRSIPRPPFEKIELPNTAFLVALSPLTTMPALFTLHWLPLKAMMLRALGIVPPTVVS
jgi:hypothetical protein